MLAECRVLNSIDHPNILKTYELYQDRKRFYMTMEYCEGGMLFDRITQRGNLSENVVAKLMMQLLSVIAYCHERKVIHRDLKPENILLIEKGDDLNIKVVDFGCS